MAGRFTIQDTRFMNLIVFLIHESLIVALSATNNNAVIKHPEQRVGIFIDTQNMYHSARDLYNARVNFGKLVEEASATDGSCAPSLT